MSTIPSNLSQMSQFTSSFGAYEHVPVAMSQVPGIWQLPGGAHITGSVPSHCPVLGAQ
jgi:hypothetical protein